MRAILTLSHVEVVELSDKSCGEWEGGDKVIYIYSYKHYIVVTNYSLLQ